MCENLPCSAQNPEFRLRKRKHKHMFALLPCPRAEIHSSISNEPVVLEEHLNFSQKSKYKDC